MSQAKKEIFLSYGREPDVIYFVKRLKEDLVKNGFSVWLDCDDISSGSDWHGAIGTALDNCQAVIPVVTNKYVASRFCKGELYTADSDKKLIFPVFLEDVDLSASELSRGVKYIIAGINWTFFRSGLEEYPVSLMKLIQGMREKGLGPGGVDSVDAAGAITQEMAQLQLSPDQPHPSAPPPPARAPSPQPSSTPYGYYTSPPPLAPQPYISPPSQNPLMPLPPLPPNSYSHAPSVTPPTLPYPAATGPGNPAYHASPYYPPPVNIHQTPPTNHAHHTSPNSGYYHQPQAGSAHQTPPTSYYTSPPSTSGPYPPPGHAPHMYTSPPGPGYYPNVHQTPPTGHAHHTAVNYYPAPPGHAYQSPPPGHAYPPPPPDSRPYNVEPPPPYELQNNSNQTVVKKPSFKVGMKLEAVDRRFPYFVCVATVMDKHDHEGKVLIHFDGWGADYNYWCCYGDVELHPAGWCEKNGWDLQPPHGQTWNGWSAYLEETHSEKAPLELFNDTQLATPSSLLFAPGMKLEAKDRVTPSQVCAASIADVRPGEIKVHYEGWGSEHDFWCLSSSADIHPCMWSGKYLGKACEPPKGLVGVFKWSQYLAVPNTRPAPAHLFNEAQRVLKMNLEEFQVGMKLEAKDRLNPTMVAVATIADIKDEQLLIHFDGWTSKFDYWCPPDCVDIHPVGWCEGNGRDVYPPKGMSQPFSWTEYLSTMRGTAAPKALFTKKQCKTSSGFFSKAAVTISAPKSIYSKAHDLATSAVKVVSHSNSSGNFKPGMKLEAKDRQHPSLVCVATVTKINKKGQLLIHFDGWTDAYDYWCEPDSVDIHPVGWCHRHNHTLQKPNKWPGSFDWTSYLALGHVAAPSSLFTAAQT